MAIEAEAFYQSGLQQFYGGEPDAACSTLTRALALAPERADIREALAASERARAVAEEVIPQSHAHHQAIQAAQLARSDRERNSRQIVFVCERVQPRPLRLAKTLMAHGFEVIVLYRHPTDLDLSQACSQSIRFSDCWEALVKAAALRPVAFHLFSPFADPTALVFARHKPGPVLFDYLEIHAGLILGKPLDLKSLYEKWQLEILAKIDGLCCKDLQYRMAVQCNGWERHPNVIWFPTYPETSSKPPAPAADQPVKMIIAGFIENPDGGLSGAAKLFAPFMKAGFTLDIYLRPDRNTLPPEQREAMYAPVLELGASPGQIVLRNSVDPYTLVQKISAYDIGVAFGTGALIAQNNDERFSIYTRAHSEGGLACRVCDYISAGVAVLGMPETRLNRFICRRYGRWITAASPLTDAAVADIRRTARDQTSPKLPKTFTMSGNIDRLYKFYARTCARIQESDEARSTPCFQKSAVA